MSVEVLMLSGALSGVATMGLARLTRRRSKLIRHARRKAQHDKRDASESKIKRTDFSEKKVRRHLALSLISLPLLKIPYFPVQLIAVPMVIYSSSIDDARYEIGYGIQVALPDTERGRSTTIHVGSARFMAMHDIEIPDPVSRLQSRCRDAGYSLVYVALDGQLIGVIELHASIRPEARELVCDLRQRGLTLCILSGDHEQPTRSLAQELGIDDYFAEVLPEDKAEVVERLQAEGKNVCVVGDGINDSIALKKANVSISLSGASSIAVDSAAIILMDGNLAKLPKLFEISRDFADNLTNGFRISVASGMICIGGIFFLGWGLVASILLYNTSRVVSVSNAMLPLLTRKQASE